MRAVKRVERVNRVRKVESLPVSAVAEGFDFADAREALVEKFLFERQVFGSWGERPL
jgi:hypothetical protein